MHKMLSLGSADQMYSRGSDRRNDWLFSRFTCKAEGGKQRRFRQAFLFCFYPAALEVAVPSSAAEDQLSSFAQSLYSNSLLPFINVPLTLRIKRIY